MASTSSTKSTGVIDFATISQCPQLAEDVPGSTSEHAVTMSLSEAARAVKLTHEKTINAMNMQQLNDYDITATHALIQESLTSILAGNVDPTSIATESLAIVQSLKKQVDDKLTELSISSSLPTLAERILAAASPIRKGPSPKTNMTQPKVQCFEGCDKEHKGKPIGCSLCQTEFHTQCVGINGRRPTVWFCNDCSNISRTIKSLQNKLSETETIQQKLRADNDDLKEKVEHQDGLIKELKAKLDSHTVSSTPSRSTPETTQHTTRMSSVPETTPGSAPSPSCVLIGDSIIKDINPKGLHNTEVVCMRGKKIQDVKAKLEDMEVNDVTAIMIHAGTNDCANTDSDVDTAADTYRDMIDDLNSRNPDAAKIISSIAPRSDKAENQTRVNGLNKKLKGIAESRKNCIFVDNDNSFIMKDGSIDSASLNGSKLHLSSVGTKKLLSNLNSVHTIIRPKQKEGNARSRKEPHNAPAATGGSSQRSRDTRRHTRSNGPRHVRTQRRGCYNCGELNHHRKDCGYSKPIQCFSCDGFGHKRNSCNVQ